MAGQVALLYSTNSLISLPIIVRAPTIARIRSGSQANVERRAVITDVSAVKPPDGNWNNANFRTWVTDPEEPCYTYMNVTRLGLAKPWRGKNNAESHVIFALCLRFKALDCVGEFQYHIKPRSVTARNLDRARA